MLLTSTYYSHMPNQHYATHAPIRSSPLRERSANACAGLFDFNMESQNSENQLNHSQRAFKANPMLQTRDAATKRRRDMFFKRVQNHREEKKWESRGDQVCHGTGLRPCVRVLTQYSFSNWTLCPSGNGGRARRLRKHHRQKTTTSKSWQPTQIYHSSRAVHHSLSQI